MVKPNRRSTNPSRPATSMTTTSNMELPSAYTPTTHRPITNGIRACGGIDSRRVNSPTSGRLSTSNIWLAMYIAAMTVQNSSGWSCTNVGPGTIPLSSNAASTSAIVGANGIPNASNGTNAAPAAALLAASGPATPSTAPRPNFSGCFDSFRSATYDANVDSTAAGPGTRPSRKIGRAHV